MAHSDQCTVNKGSVLCVWQVIMATGSGWLIDESSMLL